jgi:hypothetical protein
MYSSSSMNFFYLATDKWSLFLMLVMHRLREIPQSVLISQVGRESNQWLPKKQWAWRKEWEQERSGESSEGDEWCNDGLPSHLFLPFNSLLDQTGKDSFCQTRNCMHECHEESNAGFFCIAIHVEEADVLKLIWKASFAEGVNEPSIRERE